MERGFDVVNFFFFFLLFSFAIDEVMLDLGSKHLLKVATSSCDLLVWFGGI